MGVVCDFIFGFIFLSFQYVMFQYIRRCYNGSLWWCHQMVTSSALLVLCVGNSPVTGEFPSQRPVTRSFDVFLDLCLNKRLNKQSWGWWFETSSCSLWRQYSELYWTSPQPPVEIILAEVLYKVPQVKTFVYRLVDIDRSLEHRSCKVVGLPQSTKQNTKRFI